MKILAIDGNSILNRAFYGIRLLSTSSGEYTNAVYGFLSTYFRVNEDIKPDAVCSCFDLKAPTYRLMEYAGYKAGRRPMPQELVSQVPLIKEVLDDMGIPCLELPGYEADDLLGTISRICEEHDDCTCVVLTGDRDSFQLAGPSTTIRLVSTKAGKPVTTDYGPDEVMEKYGVTPRRMIDVKALMGDASDNIPGVRGVGEKTALDLVKRFGSVEDIYKNLETLDIRETLRKKLKDGEKSAVMSLRLAVIDRNAPLDFTPEAAVSKPMDEGKLFSILKRLELRTVITKLGLRPVMPSPAVSPATAAVPQGTVPEIPPAAVADMPVLTAKLSSGADAAVLYGPELDWAAVALEKKAYVAVRSDCAEDEYKAFLCALASPRVKKSVCGVKDVLTEHFRQDIPFGGFDFDAAVAAYLIDPAGGKYGLDNLSSMYLGAGLPEPEFKKEGAFSPLNDRKDTYRAISAYLDAICRLRPVLESRLGELGMSVLMTDIELPLTEVLAWMQYKGCLVDHEGLKAYGAVLGARLAELENLIYAQAGEKFNINSPKQLGEILFERLKLPAGRKTKSGWSTDARTLARLEPLHPIAGMLTEYRQLSKLKSTYADGLLKVIDPADGRIHSEFNQLSTVTGRISSSDPNLQNIPVRRELGAELRRMFVAAPGFTLVDADYSQIELRVLAHISGDENMREAFAIGQDIHRLTAASVAGVEPEEVTPAMRSKAKAVNFGIVYGIGAFGLAQQIHITRAEAKNYIDGYFNKFPGVRKYMDDIKKRAAEDGYVSTLSGRRRPIPEIKSTNHNIRAFGERVALNTPIQGTAADIIKLAMIAVYKRLRKENLRSRLILQVHDELIVEAAKDEAEYVKTLIEEEMRGAMKLDVELKADSAVADNWYDAKG